MGDLLKVVDLDKILSQTNSPKKVNWLVYVSGVKLNKSLLYKLILK